MINYMEYDDLSKLEMINKEDKELWMNERMAKGFSFNYHKGELEGYSGKINVGVTCVETDEYFPFFWK